MKFKALFQPLQINGMKVRNRLVVPPMGTGYAESDNTISQRLIDYHEEKARGGFGLITLEITAPDPRGKAGPVQVALWEDSFIPGLKKLADAVHAHGACLSVQLHHAGRQTTSMALGGLAPVAPSPLPCPFCREMPEELSTEEVYRIIERFVDAAERARDAGADAVELHGAHGYLIAQFMSRYSNARTDEFGGSLENRMRLPILMVRGIRERLGNAYPVIFRLSGEEQNMGGRRIAETRAVCRMLEDAGVDALHVTAGTYAEMSMIWGAYDSPLAYMAQFAEEVKKSTSLPVITAGRINDPYVAEELIASGRVDMVSLGRQSIADPHFPNKVLAGKTDEIAPCIGCHQGCTGFVMTGRPVTCVVNPFAGREGEMKLTPAETPRNVMVVGAGPAGLACAMLCAKRGHHVHLYEKSGHVGGQYRLAALPPGKSDIVKMIVYYDHMGQKLGVQKHMGEEVSAETIRAAKPDVLVLATGGVPLVPPIEGINDSGALHAVDVLAGTAGLPAGKVLIAGGGMVGCEVADYLGSYGADVTMVEMRPEMGMDVTLMIRLAMLPRLRERGVRFVNGAEIRRFVPGGVHCVQGGEEMALTGFDAVVLAMGVRSYNPLAEQAAKLVGEVHAIGDAAQAGNVLGATAQAADLALKI